MKTNHIAHKPTLSTLIAKGAALGALTVYLWFVGNKALDYARAMRNLTKGLEKSLDEPWHWMTG